MTVIRRSIRHCALIATILLCGFDLSARGGDAVVENVVLITLDGLRGEELFGGADQRLMTPENGVKTPDQLKSKFWKETRTERRELLMPFLWKMSLSKSGWIAGDIEADSHVAVSNGMFFSYPGYNEILTGKPDPAVDSNDKKYNANVTVLEWLHGKDAFRGKVAAYTSWDVFPFIINDKRSGIPVNSGWQKFEVGEANRVATLNLVSEQLFHEWDGVRYDVLTTAGAIEELTTRTPRVLFVGLGETDDWAHAGRYDRYLLAAQQNDRFIELLWETCQKLPSHRDKTLFLITTDHGRGIDREGWKNHGTSHPGSERIWVAAFGPGVRQGGIDTEGKFVPGKFVQGKFVQAQVAATVAAALGEDFTTSSPGIHPPLPFLEAD
jgi:hypothetical protein